MEGCMMEDNSGVVEVVDPFDDALFAVASKTEDGQFCVSVSVNDGVGVDVTWEMWKEFRNGVDEIFWLQNWSK
jgi:hypothetical protein